MSAHFALWGSIDFIAKLRSCSCSKIARKGNLDPTAFNKSKRTTKYGKHWISFNSLVRALDGANMNLVEFAVIYQILYTYKTIPEPKHVQKIIAEIDGLLQHHMETIPKIGLIPQPERSM